MCLGSWPSRISWYESVVRNCVKRAARAIAVMVVFIARFHAVCSINNICNSTPRHRHFWQGFLVQNSIGVHLEIELVSLDSRLQCVALSNHPLCVYLRTCNMAFNCIYVQNNKLNNFYFQANNLYPSKLFGKHYCY